MNEIVPIFKPKSVTPTQLITTFRDKFPTYAHEKISPAGRLDPMAEGLLVLLIGEANKKRGEFLKMDKTYEFTFLFGIMTDSYDSLGRIMDTNFSFQPNKIKKQLHITIHTNLGKSNQAYPPYSSKTVQGKPLFYWARENKLNEIVVPSKDIEIKEIELLSFFEQDKSEVIHEILTQIQNCTG